VGPLRKVAVRLRKGIEEFRLLLVSYDTVLPILCSWNVQGIRVPFRNGRAGRGLAISRFLYVIFFGRELFWLWKAVLEQC
jgi:hypothetical protein